MSQLSEDCHSPQYDLHHQKQNSTLAVVIQNIKTFRALKQKLENLDAEEEKLLQQVPENEIPEGFVFNLEYVELYEEGAQLILECTALGRELWSHGHRELYTAMEKLSDADLDRVLTSLRENILL